MATREDLLEGDLDGFADSLVRRALTTLEHEEARPLWEESQRIIHEDQPYTFLYYLNERLGLSQRLHGVVADALPGNGGAPVRSRPRRPLPRRYRGPC